MSAIKLHVYRGDNPGTDSCDFRGDNAIGHDQGDEHRTVAEIDPATEETVAVVLEMGPEANALLDKFKEIEPGFFGAVATALGLAGDGPVGLRFGVWDN